MKKNKLNGIEDAFYYYEKLDNGLDCYLIPYENKNNYFITYATRYGSNQTEFIPKGKKEMIKVPDGIAHFLEHKMFEQKDGVDPFTFYAKTGTGANASTSFESTQYICYGTQNIKENLDYLLNYVNEPYFTDENVEKEKGIIAEEIKMYDDIPEWELEEEIRKSIYHVHPMRVDIAGDIEEINKITKEDLYDCYNTYYQPSNMFLIVAGKFDKDEIIDCIKNNRSMKKSYKENPILEKQYDEKREIHEKTKQLAMNIVVPKIGYAIKLDRKKMKIKDDALLDMYLQMFSTITFGLSSKFREEARSKKLMTSFYTSWERASHFKTFMIMAETTKPEDLLKYIKEEIRNVEITDEEVERMKKVWISSEVQMVDIVETTVNNMYDDIIKYGYPMDDKIEKIKSLKAEELTKLIKDFDLDNSVEIIALPKESKK